MNRFGLQKILKSLTVLIFLFLFLGNMHIFGQEQFKMDENTFQQFTRAKRMFEKGKVFFLKKNYKKAEEALLKCVEYFPQYSQADYFLSQIYYNKQDYIKALKHMESAKENYGFMANLLVAAQNKYLDELREQRRAMQNNLAELTSRSDIERAKKDIADIDVRLSEPVPVLPQKSADYFYFHGNIFMKLKKFNEAHSQYLEALQLDPTHGSASNNLASLYYMIKKYDKALFYLNQAEANGVTINPEFKKALLAATKKEKSN
jgi:tetratricopeptide (TPR) repeat protein